MNELQRVLRRLTNKKRTSVIKRLNKRMRLQRTPPHIKQRVRLLVSSVRYT